MSNLAAAYVQVYEARKGRALAQTTDEILRANALVASAFARALEIKRTLTLTLSA